MKKILITLLLLSFKVFAQIGPVLAKPNLNLQVMPRTPLEAWVKLTCFGQTTPNHVYPLVVKNIATFHVRVNPNEGYPDLQTLRNANSEFFKNITRYCTEKRQSMMDLSHFTGTLWLDWDTDTGYTKLALGEEFIYDNSCRALNKPCISHSQCCGYNAAKPYLGNTCNVKTNTCENNSIAAQINQPIRSN